MRDTLQVDLRRCRQCAPPPPCSSQIYHNQLRPKPSIIERRAPLPTSGAERSQKAPAPTDRSGGSVEAAAATLNERSSKFTRRTGLIPAAQAERRDLQSRPRVCAKLSFQASNTDASKRPENQFAGLEPWRLEGALHETRRGVAPGRLISAHWPRAGLSTIQLLSLARGLILFALI